MIGRAAIADAWLRRGARERTVLAVLAAIVVAAIVVFAVLRPLAGAVESARADATRAEALLAAARADRTMEDTLTPAAPATDSGNATTGGGNPATAVTRALAQHGLAPLAPPRAADDGSVDVIVAAAPFDALVRALDALAHSDDLHVEHAVLTRLADADGVRAELSLRSGAPH